MMGETVQVCFTLVIPGLVMAKGVTLTEREGYSRDGSLPGWMALCLGWY